jgi:hypothetical protein
MLALVGPDHHSAKKPQLGRKKYKILHHEIIMEIWLKKDHHSSNPGQNHGNIAYNIFC